VEIAAGDLLQIKMFGVEEFSTEARVDGTGDISVPYIGSVHVEGLSNSAAEHLIEKKLKDGGFFKSPDISIAHKEFTTQGISVLGEVQKPGIIPLMGKRKLFDVISAAGGTTPKAGDKVSIAHRSDQGKPITVTLSKDPARALDANIDVMPGDTVVVSKAGIVYVVGDVRLPGGFVMEHGNQMTVLQAISMAQGTNPTASLGDSKLIRKTEDGRQEIPISIKYILAGKQTDQRLQDEDILFVPVSAGKSAARRSMDAILQVATGVAIYRR
jgi:polysaccharide export outer membrane protein